jgi:glycosyltransferase involved in cell wall biosynthesis
MSNNLIEISIVLPVYNSSLTIRELVSRIQKALNPLGITYELILADDCSPDESWQKILDVCHSHKEVIGLRLSKNYGQWFSTLAGMSVASGRYIVTIDDDLEYDPDDIIKLYQTITYSRLSVVFGIAKNKYRLQGKSILFYNLINAFLNIIWNSQPRVSFKIIERILLYSDNDFIIQEPLDTFIAHNVNRDLWGYSQVKFGKRFAGKSNYSLAKKIKLFFIYSSYYVIHPFRWIAFYSALFFIIGINGYCLFLAGHLNMPGQVAILIALLFTMMIALYYLTGALIRSAQSSLYSIAESINRRVA